MRKEIFQEIEVPEGMDAEIKGDILKIKSKDAEIEKKFGMNKISFEKKGGKIILGNKKATKNEKKMINTIAAHIRNMIAGLNEKYEYKLRICSSHFPITVEVNGNEVLIKNFLGEKVPRKTRILKNVEVNVEKDIIKVSSFNKENAGQTAANLEKATVVRARDRRAFQDGIFITSKAGRAI